MYPTREDIDRFLNAARVNDRATVMEMVDAFNGNIVNQKGTAGLTVMMWAAMHGQKDIIDLLLQNGAHVHEKDDEGRTALMWAAMHGDRTIIEALLKHGANADERTFHGLTALMYAARLGKYEAALLLLQATYAFDATDRNGNTAMMHAQAGHHADIIRIMEPLARARAQRLAEAERQKVEQELAKKAAEHEKAEKRLDQLKTRRPPKPNLKKPPGNR